MKSILRSAKNFTKGYSDIQVLVREATSNEESGPTMIQLDEIAVASFNPLSQSVTRFSDIIYIIDKRLNDHGKYWRHVYKTLLVLEYCICFGADPMVTFAKERLHEVKTLREFISVDDHGNDNGACVREKSKDIVGLLSDEDMLSNVRRKKEPPANWRPPSVGPLTITQGGRRPSPPPISSYPGGNSSQLQSRQSFDDLQNVNEEEAMALAIANSKAEYESLRSFEDERDSGFPALLRNASRSSSASNPGPLSADQLLDLDDDAFVQALESSYPGSRNESSAADALNSLLTRTTATQADHQTTNDITVINPFEMQNGSSFPFQNVTVVDPFSESVIQQDSFTEIPDTTKAQPSSSIHPIAIPNYVASEVDLGAKPVFPGTMAPQFTNMPTNNKHNNNEGDDVCAPKPRPQEPNTAHHRDPFADLM